MLSLSSLKSMILQLNQRRWTNSQCQLCQLPLPDNESIWCRHCIAHFPQPPHCARCGTTTVNPVEQCGQCLRSPPPWHRLYRLGEYDFPLKQIIHQLKFNGKFWLAKPLADQFVLSLDQPAPLILPVPLHATRRFNRGFNQSAHLAWAIAKATNSQCIANGFKRQRYTKVQKQLTKNERKKNVHQAFILKIKSLPKHVAIVDDVVTTGSTVAELTRLLLNNGVERVDVYCICYTPSIE
ncbi:ComF family protein [Photobacterium profundum]|uniref:ComF family protein n=1 Tax=Photobacterium profundum TaxID=74109 RepID=UPI003D14169F